VPETAPGAILGRLIGLYLRVVGPTLRVHRLGRRGARPAPSPDPARAAVYAALHGDQAALAGSHGGGFATLASASRDGSLAASVLRTLGHRVHRGSSSRGGASALLGLRRAVRSGASALVTVDGPRGPRGRAAPGVVVLARATERPLVPVVAVCRPVVRLRSWDRLQIPLPFARVLVIYGRPLGTSGPRVKVAEALSRGLARLEARALRVLGTQP